MKIKNEKFNNDGMYYVNNEIRILKFDVFMECYFDNINVDGVINNEIYNFFNEIKQIKNHYNRKYNKTDYSNFDNYLPNKNIINHNVINDLMWKCKYFPETMKIINCIKQESFNNDNCVVIEYNIISNEQLILFDIERKNIYFFGCMDDYKKYNAINNFPVYTMITSLLSDVITWG